MNKNKLKHKKMEKLTVRQLANAKKSAPSMSENDFFYVYDKKKHKDEFKDEELFVHKSKRFNHPFLRKIGSDGDYDIFEYDGLGVRDCLQLSESFACGIKDYTDETSQWKEKITHREFGVSPEENIQILKKILEEKPYYQSEKVNPKVGEAFAIVDFELRTRSSKRYPYPYHIGTVIAEDGDDRIVVETFAGKEDAIDEDGVIVERSKPVFAIYNISDKPQTFFEKWRKFYQKPMVIHLVPKKSQMSTSKKKSPALRSKSPKKTSRTKSPKKTTRAKSPKNSPGKRSKRMIRRPVRYED